MVSFPVAAAPADSTWVQLKAPTDGLERPVFALAVNPTDPANLLLGTASGSLLRSADAGSTWKEVRPADGHPVVSIAFSPLRPGLVLAGLQAGGVLRSQDSGQAWSPAGGERNTVRSFGFAQSLIVAGSDHGVLVSRDGLAWSASGLAALDVSAVTVTAAADPVRILAGADASRGTESVPIYQSSDGGANWAPLPLPQSASTMVATVVAGPPGRDVRPVVLGTNAGLFASGDGGATFAAVRSGVLPATDFTQVAFVRDHPERMYVASDGGASNQGGVWSTTDGGANFRSLNPPVQAVTALAVSTADFPTLYAATFRPADHLVTIWAYRDTGAAPQGQAPPPPAASGPGGAAAATRRHGDWWRPLLTGPEAPYLLMAGASLLVLLLATGAYLRGGRER